MMLSCARKTHQRFLALLALATLLSGCNSILNGWLSPIELGAFSRETTNDIRGSLSIQDTPFGISGVVDPSPDDLAPTVQEYKAIAGDVLNVYVLDLRQRGVETIQQPTVDSRGMINLPVVGPVRVESLGAREIEDEIRRVLADRSIVYNAEVLVEFAAKRGMTYTIFGNEDLAVRLNRGPGVFPISRPDFRLIEAIAVSGGLSELVNEIYVFRRLSQDQAQAEAVEEIKRQRISGEIFEPVDSSDTRLPEQPRIDEFEPPPLPSVIPSVDGGLGFAAPSAAGKSETFARQESVRQEPVRQEPDRSNIVRPIEVVSAATRRQQEPPPPDSRSDDDADDRDAELEEILELMRSQKPTASGEPPPGESPPAPARSESPLAPPPGESPLAPDPGQPNRANQDQRLMDPGREESRWIYDPVSQGYIEIRRKEDRFVETPIVPPGEDAIRPAIDWDALAGGIYDIRTIRVSAQGLRQGDPRYNLVVRPGDVIRLYSGDIGFYYIIGHVLRPGVFSFRSGASVTLKNAIASAGGLDALAWPDRVTVYRRVDGREQMIQVNLDRIFAGLDSDFFLKRDDIINVGTHPFAPFLVRIRNLTLPRLDSSMSFIYEWSRQETFFKSENLDAPNAPGLFP